MSDSRKQTSTRFVSGVLDAENASTEHGPAMVANLARKMARELLVRGPLGTAGLVVTIETKDLEPFESEPIPDTERQLDVGHVTDVQGTPRSYDCGCGWSTEDVLELVTHLEGHGVRRVIVTPQMGRRR